MCPVVWSQVNVAQPTEAEKNAEAEKKAAEAKAAEVKKDTPPGANQEPGPEAARDLAHKQGMQQLVLCASFVTMGGVIFGLFLYISRLRDQLAETKDSETQSLRAQLPLGLPDGSVRAGLAILIVLGTMFAFMVSVVGDLAIKAPEALTGVLGTILGFYFGREGSAESAQRGRAMAQVATAHQGVAVAQGQARQAEQALESSQRDRTADAAALADPILATAKTIVETIHPEQSAKFLEEIARAKAAIDAARAAGKADELKSALDAFLRDGPIASIVKSFGSSLAPLIPGGTTVSALRALAALSERLSPGAAQHSVARIVNAPYRDGLIEPVVDDGYANTLISGVPQAAEFVKQLQSNPPQTAANGVAPSAPLTEVEIVKLILHEDAAATMAAMWKNQPSIAANMERMIPALQRRALEVQLESEIPPELVKPFGGFASYFRALDTIQTSGEAGLQALDFVVAIVRAARPAGASATDVLPPAV